MAACASTGNLANSVAAHAARAGMASVVFIPHDLEAAKVTMTAVYGGTVVAVEGTYDDVNRLCAELASEHPGWAFVNVNVRTYYAEGSKTLAFEVAEQLGWQAPDHVVVPVASGSQLTKVAKGFDELGTVGLLDEAPHGADLGRPGGRAARRWPPPSPRGPTPSGRSSRTPSPSRSPSATRPTAGTRSRPSGESGGACASVTDDEIIEGIRLLARTEGIFAETAGGVTIATLAKLAASGVVRRDERVVAFVTGHGLKTVEALAGAGRPDRDHRPDPRGLRRRRRPARTRRTSTPRGARHERHRPDPDPAAHPDRRGRRGRRSRARPSARS